MRYYKDVNNFGYIRFVHNSTAPINLDMISYFNPLLSLSFRKKAIFENIANISKGLIHPTLLNDDDENIPEEFNWFFIKDIHISVKEVNYDNKYTITHTKQLNTIRTAQNALNTYFKGVYSLKNDNIYTFKSNNKEYNINGLDKVGNMTSQTYKTFSTSFRDDVRLESFPSAEKYYNGLLGGIGGYYTRIRYDNIFTRVSVLDSRWWGDFDSENVSLTGTIKSEFLGKQSKYDNRNHIARNQNKKILSEYNTDGTSPRFNLLDVPSLYTLLNFTYPKISNIESDDGENEERVFLLENEEYEKQLMLNKTYSILLDFANLSGGLISAGMWMQTLISLGEHAIDMISKKAREKDAINNYSNSAIEHLVLSRGIYSVEYTSTSYNIAEYTYHKDVETPYIYEDGESDNNMKYVYKNKKPYISIPINTLIKSSKELSDTVDDIVDMIGISMSSYTINVIPYMDSEYGNAVESFSKLLFSNGRGEINTTFR